MSGTIYYIGARDIIRVKIGFTTGPVEKRLKALQTGSPVELQIITSHPGTMEDERSLHQRFADYCVGGEWFEIPETVFAHLKQALVDSARLALAQGKQIDPHTFGNLGSLRRSCELPTDLECLFQCH